ncbi:hypothetical protein [Rhodoferax sediminis]|uniref:Polysaccharide polymerase n=1 Tax=Rhodoferax sediminis TaxID=2509614 RepID=A0A515DFG6_9BURK|nr:hypothetical protein [Rhodoferax sediminis]QDL39140.1 hypothetical protein EUB48_18900 [Rhodoferax sediminis]
MKEKSSRIFVGDFLCFIFIFIFLFGIKVEYFDSSIFVPLIIVFMISGGVIKLDGRSIMVAVMISILLIYQTIIQLIGSTSDLDSILRLLRASLTCVIMAIFIGSVPFSAAQILRTLFFALLVHAILIISATMVESINISLSHFSGNERILPAKSSGLLAGYDIAGLFCVIGCLMLSFKIYRPRGIFTFIVFNIIFGLGCFFTSRLSIALFVMFFVSINFLNLIKSKIKILSKVMIFVVSFVIIGFILFKYIVPIIDVTFSLDLVPVSDDLYNKIVSNNAVQSPDQFLWAYMFFLPNDIFSSIFGTGVEALQSDVGYVKDIFRYGFIGVLYSLFIYGYLYCRARVALALPKSENYSKFLAVVFILILVMTFKNNYIFTRGMFPLIVLVASVPLFMIKKYNSSACFESSTVNGCM